MSELCLDIMTRESPPGFSCGEASIDEMIRSAYARTVFQQATAYSVTLDGRHIGSCMIRFVHLVDEDADYYEGDHEFIALEISYLAIDRRLHHCGFGSFVLRHLIAMAKELASRLPVRFLVLDAFQDKVSWYSRAGFKTYPKRKDLRYPNTVPMRMDLIDRDRAAAYEDSLF